MPTLTGQLGGAKHCPNASHEVETPTDLPEGAREQVKKAVFLHVDAMREKAPT